MSLKRAWPFVAIAAAVLLAVYVAVQRAGSVDEKPAGEVVQNDSGNGPATSPADLPGDSETATEPSDSASTLPEMVLALDGEGLRLFNARTGASRPIPFGTSGDAARSMLAAALGAEPVEEGASAECAGSYARFESGLTTWFVDDTFVGWAVRGPAPRLTTASGIGIGSPRSDLESVYDARIFQSSLGAEFQAGGLAGLLESEDPGARIVHLWAGRNCIAR